MNHPWWRACAAACLYLLSHTAPAADFEIRAPAVVHAGVPFQMEVLPAKTAPETAPRDAVIQAGGEVGIPFTLTGAPVIIEDVSLSHPGETVLSATASGVYVKETTVRVIPGWMSILPPLIAIGLALWLRTVIPALFLGVWAGVLIRDGFSFTNLFRSLLDAFQVDVVRVLTDPDHIAILLFSCMIGGMVGIISRNGGMQGVVNRVVRWASTPRRGQLSVWLLGMLVFFDDYTNTLVVGNAVRPITDRLRISREKLAYIVDSTAAPVACLALITTWIGYEVGLIAEAIGNIDGIDQAPYEVFLRSIPFSFYPLLAIFFVFLIASGGRDFGPMLAAERRSYATGKVAPETPGGRRAEGAGLQMNVPDTMPQRPLNAIVPILVLISGCIGGLWFTGSGDTIQGILSTADAYKALMWGSLLGVVAAAVLTLAQRLLTVHEVMEAWTEGFNIMVAPLFILVLAWALSDGTEILGTADWLIGIGGGSVSPYWVPAWCFVLAALTAFATGSSWGVMAILLPLVVPLVWATMQHAGVADPEHLYLVHSTVACVLGGAVWGDHCSPISDTTVLSSMASGCDHIEHVRTQLPYALAVGFVALIFGTIPTAYGLPWWVALPAAGVMLVVLLRWLGRHAGLEAQVDS